MATATQKQRTAREVAPQADPDSQPGAITFLVFEDNVGDYRWSILDHGGKALALSAPFASHDAAYAAAAVVRDAPGSLRLQREISADRPAYFGASSAEATHGRGVSDVDRGSTEEGRFDSEVVSQWPARA